MERCECPIHPAGNFREQPKAPDTEESTPTQSHSMSEEPFSLALEHYLNKTFEWKVSGYSRLVSPDKFNEAQKTYFRRSPSFRFMDRIWYLHLYPNLPNMVVCLMLSGKATGPPARLRHRFGLKDNKGKIEWKIHAIGNFGSGTQTVWKKRKGFLSMEELTQRQYQLVKDDVLTIICGLTSDERMRFLRDFVCTKRVVNELKRKEEDHDVTFQVRDQAFAFYLNVLRLHSPVFAQLVPGSTLVIDCEPELFVQLLLYMDKGKVWKISLEETLKLYGLAVTYQVRGLRERCLAYMTTLLKPDVVLEVLDFAKKHSEPELLEVATKYLVSHALQVVSTVEWRQMIKKDPERANQLYLRIAAVCPKA